MTRMILDKKVTRNGTQSSMALLIHPLSTHDRHEYKTLIVLLLSREVFGVRLSFFKGSTKQRRGEFRI